MKVETTIKRQTTYQTKIVGLIVPDEDYQTRTTRVVQRRSFDDHISEIYEGH